MEYYEFFIAPSSNTAKVAAGSGLLIAFHDEEIMRNSIMRKTIFGFLALVAIVTQLTGCVVYERPYGPHYYHGWFYR